LAPGRRYKNLNNMSLLGIDIGNSSIKIVEVEKKGGNAVLTGFSLIEIPLDLLNKHPEREVFQADAIKKFLLHTRGKQAIIAIGGLEVVSKIITLPSLKDEEVAEAAKWQMKDELPFKIEEGVFSYFKIGSADKNKNNYLVVTAKQDVVLKALQTAGLAGIKPVSIIPASEALFYAFELEIKQPGVVCLLYMGKYLTNISFYGNGALQFARDIPIGTDDITKAMTSILVSEEGRLELSYDEAEKIRIQYGIPMEVEKFPKLEHIPIAHLQAVVRPAIEKIEEEIIRTIEYYRNKVSDTKINKVIFAGSASQTPNLAEIISSSIGIKCETAVPLSRITVPDNIENKDHLVKDAPRLGTAIGAVLAEKSRINLIPEEYRDPFKAMLKRRFTPVSLLVLVFILLSGVYAFFYGNIYLLNEEKTKLKKTLAELQPKIARMEELAKSAKEAEGRKGLLLSVAADRIRISSVLSNLSLNVPPVVMLKELSFSPSSEALTIKGLSFEKEQKAEKGLSKFISSLSLSDFFDDVELVQAGQGLDYTPKNFKFELKAEIKKR